MSIDIIVGNKIQTETLEKVEKELGRKLTENELEVFWKTSRIAMMKGHNYARQLN